MGPVQEVLTFVHERRIRKNALPECFGYLIPELSFRGHG